MHKIYLATLDDNYINAFKIEDGVPVIRYKKPEDNYIEDDAHARVARKKKDDCSGITCGMEGDEILIIASSGGGGNANSFPVTGIYCIGGSGPLIGFQDPGAVWNYGRGGGGKGSNYVGDDGNKEAWDCSGNKVYNPSTKTCECPEGMVDNGYECVVAVEVIDKLTGKAKCVYDKLLRSAINNHNLITETFLHFGKGNPFKSNLIYKLEPETFFKKAIGVKDISPTGNFEKVGDNYIVSLNKDNLDDRAPLEIARTILHESVHALLRYHYINGTNSFVELFGEYMKEMTGSNAITHAIMRDKYIPAIANALKQFDNDIEHISFYESLSWEGLHQFLSEEEKNKITNNKIKARNKGLNCIK